MFKSLFLLPLFLLIACSSENSVGQSAETFTQISGRLAGILKFSNSPFYVTHSIFVDSNQMLSIEPGVRLYFSDSSAFIINGRVMARGNPQKPILLVAIDNKWKGIKVIDSDYTSVFQYIVIQGIAIVDRDSSDYGAMEVNRSSVHIHNCIFKNNSAIQGGGLALINATAEIYNNIFRDNRAVAFGGGILSYNSDTRIINNTFFRNSSQNHGGGLVLFNSKNDSVQNNIFYKNSGVSGDPRIAVVTSDSTHFFKAYNFLSVNTPDPNFISDVNLQLSENSVCRNNGSPLAHYNDNDGSRNDQGAYGGPLGDWYFYIAE